MIAHKLPATTNKSIWIMGETACVEEDLTGDVNLSKTWRENYSIVRFKLKKTKKSIWCAVKMARICSIFKGGGVVRLYFLFFFSNKPETALLSLLCLSSCSIIHSLVRLFCCTLSPAVSLSLYLYSHEHVHIQYVSFSFYFSFPPLVAQVPQSCNTKHRNWRINWRSDGSIKGLWQYFS